MLRTSTISRSRSEDDPSGPRKSRTYGSWKAARCSRAIQPHVLLPERVAPIHPHRVVRLCGLVDGLGRRAGDRDCGLLLWALGREVDAAAAADLPRGGGLAEHAGETATAP